MTRAATLVWTILATLLIALAAAFLVLDGPSRVAELMPKPTPPPTASPTPEPSPTPSPTPGPTPTPTPRPSLAPDPFERLRSFVPPEYRPTCRDLRRGLPPNALAGLRCFVDSEPPTTVNYYVFETPEDMDYAFRYAREGIDITTRGGACFTGGLGEYSPYGFGSVGDVAGEVTCFWQGGQAQVRWTHWQDLVMARAYRAEGEPEEVMAWFRTGVAGPCDWACPE